MRRKAEQKSVNAGKKLIENCGGVGCLKPK